MARQSNAAYWAQRLKNMEEALLDQSYSYVENLEAQFSRAQAEIEKQIAAWYQRFASNNEISLAEAKRLLNSDELAEFHWTVGEYIAYGKQNAIYGMWMKQLENASARVHISRLDALKLQIQQQAEALYANQLDSVDAAARQIYEGSYYHTAFEVQKGLGVGWTTHAINEETIKKVLSRPWTADNQTFRDRCWTNKQNLVNSVNTQLTQMIIRGEAPDRAIAAISKQFEVSKSKAGRLVMTESAYFASAAQKDCYKELDVEQYQIVAALDRDTCDICGSLDGQVFKMSEYQEGLTAPPFHPWCRCCTAPYFADMEGLGERFARDAETGERYKVPRDMTYEQWKAKQDETLTDKPILDIINTGDDTLVVDVEIDRFTPCLVERSSGKIVDTTYELATPEDRKGLKKQGWLFNWNHKHLSNSDVYKLTLKGDPVIQGLVAIEDRPDSKAVHLSLAESAPHNKGATKQYDGVGGHLFAIAVQKSYENGYGGFIYFEAKNMELVKHYQDEFGAALIGMPHEYSMIIDEDAAAVLRSAYTLEG